MNHYSVRILKKIKKNGFNIMLLIFIEHIKFALIFTNLKMSGSISSRIKEEEWIEEREKNNWETHSQWWWYQFVFEYSSTDLLPINVIRTF